MYFPYISDLSRRIGGGGGGSSGSSSGGGSKSGAGSSSSTTGGTSGGASGGASGSKGGTSGSSGGASSGGSNGSNGSKGGTSGSSGGTSSGGSNGSNGSKGGTSGSSGGTSSGGSNGSKGSTDGSTTNGGSSGGSNGGSPRSTPINTGGSTRPAISYGAGGGRQVTIGSGLPFAGRISGGGTRDQVYGNRQYGSGYPGVTGRGVAGRGFPFVFWPIAWGGVAGVGGAAYLHTHEYGAPDNTTRPGGVIVTAAFPSVGQNTTFRLVSDNATVTSLLIDIAANCSSVIKSPETIKPTMYNESSTDPPQPEQAVQYYRASSVSLTLDAYNNTGAFSNDSSVPDTPLPSNLDQGLLNCLNLTIGAAVPLVSTDETVTPSQAPIAHGSFNGGISIHPQMMSFVGLAWILWCLSAIF
ncbi:hypothetical protein BDQ12DRAFT_682385 [Crucibulum laeve]|uniref:Uncharacterized protein n=1 Tax=Crucibulum laeve TaxID=68775 RepID=A0A5C3M3Q8_9AGAR|nr:hypothetical protein BDQ12DRAFT_682385 [Crucibulum laeve]